MKTLVKCISHLWSYLLNHKHILSPDPPPFIWEVTKEAKSLLKLQLAQVKRAQKSIKLQRKIQTQWLMWYKLLNTVVVLERTQLFYALLLHFSASL